MFVHRLKEGYSLEDGICLCEMCYNYMTKGEKISDTQRLKMKGYFTSPQILDASNYMKEAILLCKHYKNRGISCDWYLAKCDYARNRDQSKVWYVIKTKGKTSREIVLKHQKPIPKIDLTNQLSLV